MRVKLREKCGERITVEATVARFGRRNSFLRNGTINTILLRDVRSATTGDELTTHLWLDRGKRWADVTVDCVVRFDARVASYEKGYRGKGGDPSRPVEVDYRLSYPTRIEIVKSRRVSAVVEFFRCRTGSRLTLQRDYEFDRVVDPQSEDDWESEDFGAAMSAVTDCPDGWVLDRVNVVCV